MIALANDTRVWLAAGMTDMRKGFDGLSALVATTLEADPFSGQVFVFRGKRGIATFTVVIVLNCCGTPVRAFAYLLSA